MSLIHLLKTKKHEFSFHDITEILQLSEGYTRQIIADMVKKNILIHSKPKKDKRFAIYSLDWASIRSYLFTNPPSFDEIIEEIVEEKYKGLYIALDNFKVIKSAETLMELTQKIGKLDDNSTVFVTNVGIPTYPLRIELS